MYTALRILIATLLLSGTSARADSLQSATELERQTLASLLAGGAGGGVLDSGGGGAWPRRAIAAARLERYDDDASALMLTALLDDPSWHVRCFAIRSLAKRRIPQQPEWFATEDNPRVIRTALRHRYTLPPDRLARGIESLTRASTFDERLIAVELAMASGDESLHADAVELTRTIILRMGRIPAGALTPRLQRLTGYHDALSHHQWQMFLRQQGRAFSLHSAYDIPAPLVEQSDDVIERQPLSQIASMSSDAFANLETYITQLRGRKVDLAIILDCTLSMNKEIADAQTGIDDLMTFVGAVVDSLRIGIVAYRDRRSRDFETWHWDFTPHVAEARSNLFKLTTASGGDWPEAVLPALRVALNDLSWDPDRTMTLVLIGDAPPHPGYGSQCVALVANAHKSGLIAHTIQADGKPVKHFADIATSGGGRCISLADDASLTAEIAGLTIAQRHEEPMRDFFETYLRLCR